MNIVQLALFVADKARMRKLSETLSNRVRQTSQQTQGKDTTVDKDSKRQSMQADTQGEGNAGAFHKDDGMDLDSEESAL